MAVIAVGAAAVRRPAALLISTVSAAVARRTDFRRIRATDVVVGSVVVVSVVVAIAVFGVVVVADDANLAIKGSVDAVLGLVKVQTVVIEVIRVIVKRKIVVQIFYLSGLFHGHLGLILEEVPADCHVEHPVEGLVKGLAVCSVRILALSRPHAAVNVDVVKLLSVEQAANLPPRPFQRPQVKAGAKVDWKVKVAAAVHRLIGKGGAVVQCAADLVHPVAPVFHYVDLTVGGVVSVGTFLRQHPNGWPELLPAGQFSPCLKLSPARGEVVAVVLLRPCLNDQVAAVQANVLRAMCRVRLQLVVVGGVQVVLPLGLGSLRSRGPSRRAFLVSQVTPGLKRRGLTTLGHCEHLSCSFRSRDPS
ncbi:hypothetical protein TYRP_020690, partial [Tyrophagus putrescentiae]